MENPALVVGNQKTQLTTFRRWDKTDRNFVEPPEFFSFSVSEITVPFEARLLSEKWFTF